MKNLLKAVLDSMSDLFSRYGITSTFIEGAFGGSCSANLDSSKYVGTVTHWPESRFEFQFNDCVSGDVILLETKEMSNEEELKKYLEELVLKMLV